MTSPNNLPPNEESLARDYSTAYITGIEMSKRAIDSFRATKGNPKNRGEVFSIMSGMGEDVIQVIETAGSEEEAYAMMFGASAEFGRQFPKMEEEAV